MSCCEISVCWGTIVIVVGDCVVIRISFGGTPWVVSSRMVISWCEDLLCLPIVMTLRDFFSDIIPGRCGSVHFRFVFLVWD